MTYYRKLGGAALFALAISVCPVAAVAANADDYVAEAREHIAAGESKAAIIQLKNALQADPAHAPARVLLGTLYLRAADAAAAETPVETGAPSTMSQPS